MRKLITTLFFILALSLSANAQDMLRLSTATTRQIYLNKTADGTGETGATVTNISLSIIKHSDTSSSTVTTVSCAASGSANDCVHVAKGAYNVELSASNTDTLGSLDLCWSYTGTTTLCRSFVVVPANVYDCNVAGSCFQSVTYAVAFPNYPIWLYNSSGALVTGETTGNITCKIFKDGGAAATTNDTTETEVDATNLPGAYRIDLTATELTAYAVMIRCAGSTGVGVAFITPVH